MCRAIDFLRALFMDYSFWLKFSGFRFSFKPDFFKTGFFEQSHQANNPPIFSAGITRNRHTQFRIGRNNGFELLHNFIGRNFGLTDVINRNRSDLKDPADIKFTQSLKKATSNMVVLSFYFE